MKFQQRIMGVLILVLLTGCTQNGLPSSTSVIENTPDPESALQVLPDQIADGWQVSTLQKEGIDPGPIATLIGLIDAGDYVNINALVLVRHGKLVNEHYFGSYLQRPSNTRKPYRRPTLHQTRSSFKSVTGLLSGIAIDEEILTAEDRVMPYINQYHDLKDPDPRKQDITIRDLLDMASGLDCSEMPGASPLRESALRNKIDMVQSHAELQMSEIPGTIWQYCSTNTILLGIALEAALKAKDQGPIKYYLDTKLMAPLDITYYQTGHSPKGHMLMHGGQRMRPRDLAKFGQLIVADGQWNGKQLIPSRWIRTLKNPGRETGWSWTNSVSDDPSMQGTSRYRNQWFQTDLRFKDQNINLIHSWGNGGQFIIAIPELELVVTTTAANYGLNKVEEQKQIFHMLYHYILPALL